MDIQRRSSPDSIMHTPEIAIQQPWCNRSGVVASLEPKTGNNLRIDLASVPQTNTLPTIRIVGDTRIDSNASTCPCAFLNCKKDCCQRSRKLIQDKAQTGDDRSPLLSPIPNTNRNSRSLSSSYGSLDSRELLIDEDLQERYSIRESSIKCGCHVPEKKHTSRSAYIKLIIASVIALLFMSGEVIGGYFAGSLAIMTDAAHMLSDLAGFLISLFAIWVGSRPPSRKMSFGWHRAEVIGALLSVLIVWVLTGVLVYEAVQRVINPDLIDVKPDIMLITACIGVFVNVFMCAVLGHGHGHSHGGGHGHSHRGHGHSRRGQQQHEEEGNSRWSRLKRRLRRKNKQESVENINIRAAFVHVIGDLIQSIGVVIAGYIIWFKPDWKLADPVCTFLFCVLVFFSTINVLKDALRVLMEGAPSHIDYEDVKTDLEEIDGVKQAHSLHIWSLTTTKTALSAHLAIKENVSTQHVLDEASKMLRERHNIGHTTLQVEKFQPRMDNCSTCRQIKPKSKCCWPYC